MKSGGSRLIKLALPVSAKVHALPNRALSSIALPLKGEEQSKQRSDIQNQRDDPLAPSNQQNVGKRRAFAHWLRGNSETQIL